MIAKRFGQVVATGGRAFFRRRMTPPSARRLEALDGLPQALPKALDLRPRNAPIRLAP